MAWTKNVSSKATISAVRHQFAKQLAQEPRSEETVTCIAVFVLWMASGVTRLTGSELAGFQPSFLDGLHRGILA